jgi:hypothetical protein
VEDQVTLCKRVLVDNWEKLASSRDLENTELWLGDRRVGTLNAATDQAVRKTEHDGKSYLSFQVRWWEQELTYAEALFEVGPFDTAEEARVEFENCQEAGFEPMTGLENVPGVVFKAVNLYEPNEIVIQ